MSILIPTEECLQLVNELGEENNLKITVTESLKGGVIGAFTFTVGGLCFGPIGFLAGAAVGGVCAYFICRKFLPLHKVIMSMSPEEKERLADCVRNALYVCGTEYTVITLVDSVMGNLTLKQAVWDSVISFLTKVLKMRVKYK